MHVFATDIFSMSCAGMDRNDGVLVQAVPRWAQARGDLMDDRTWTVMLQTMSDSVVSGVMSTPPAATYLDVATPCLPALRGEGQSWFGVAEIPADIRATLRGED